LAVECLRVGFHRLGAAEYGPLLGEHDELRSERCCSACEPVRGLEVAVHVLGGVELNGGNA